jgi:hypothetical protein
MGIWLFLADLFSRLRKIWDGLDDKTKRRIIDKTIDLFIKFFRFFYKKYRSQASRKK